MVGACERFRAVMVIAGEAVLHLQKAVPDLPVVVNEVFNAELLALAGAQDDTETLGHRLARRHGKHLRIAAELDGIVRLRRTCELGVPNFIPVHRPKHREIREARKAII